MYRPCIMGKSVEDLRITSEKSKLLYTDWTHHTLTSSFALIFWSQIAVHNKDGGLYC